VLFQFGTGPVRGFAVTLAIGIIASMFTAIFVTRTFFMLYLERRRGGRGRQHLIRESRLYHANLRERELPVPRAGAGGLHRLGGAAAAGHRRDGLQLGATIGSWLNYGVDFTGGTMVHVDFRETSVPIRGGVEPGWQITRFGEPGESSSSSACRPSRSSSASIRRSR
jgi:hypothetical protein